MKVLFITQTADAGPASRYRVYQYLEFLSRRKIVCHVSPGVDNDHFSRVYGRQNSWRKLPGLAGMALRRLFKIPGTGKYDIVFLQREMIPYVYPVLEKLLCLFARKIIFDFDDALFHTPPQRTGFFHCLRYPGNIREIIKLCACVIAGNAYLEQYARQYHPLVYLLPTSIDTRRWVLPAVNRMPVKIIIGWIGTPANAFYLNALQKSLRMLNERRRVRFHFVGVKNLRMAGLEIRCLPWNYDTEVRQVQEFDIGLAPLFDDAWGRGKCGTKALQYMACGVPVVCSKAGVYKDIINDGVNGFLAANDAEWLEKLTRLTDDAGIRRRMGEAGRYTVEERFSLKTNAAKLVKILESVHYKR